MKAIIFCLLVTACLSTAFAQTNTQSCLIVRKKDGHTMLNLFLFGPPGLLVTASAKYSTVDSFHLSNAKASYWGSDLQKLSAQNVHVIVVSHKPETKEVEDARSSCTGQPAPRDPDDMNAWWKSTNPATANAGPVR
jgi:hypothetical protein